MGDFINRVLMAYRPLYLCGLLMDGQYRLPVSPPQVSRGRRVPSSPASGLAAVVAIAAAARQPIQGAFR